MNGLRFDQFFHAATGNTPYLYQCRLACGDPPTGANCDLTSADEATKRWLSGREPMGCYSRLINVPTGLGKTAAVVLAWLWNRVAPSLNSPRAATDSAEWPRRLVYCLPMRTLVDQTRENVEEWLIKLTEAHPEDLDLKWLVAHSPLVLMGGEELESDRRVWDIYPERPCILIGTQDMLLSRALNRGYGMSRYRWPMHFGLLNNDCLWVMDETQLMGVGVETSAQLDGFRHDGRMATFGACPTWWMSATLDDARLATVDHQQPDGGWPTEKLSDTEQTTGQPHKLITAQKKLSSTPLALNSTIKGGYSQELAALIKERHRPGTFTLVVLNRVSRAREVFESLTGGKKPLYPLDKAALIHSRFRPVDRERHTRLLLGDGERIVIATQAVEAGVDVSARLLITELAPWSSLVQRMGRCNRRADIDDAQVLWVDIQPENEKDKLLLPYSKNELDKTRSAISRLTDASPRALKGVRVAEEKIIRPVIRRRDLVDLFDTTPDLCGQDLDISRYIRDGDDNDVQFYWRAISGDILDGKEPEPQRRELCRVSIRDARSFFDRTTTQAWQWNPLEKRWQPAEKPRPGGVYLLATTSGGYNDQLGWTGEPKDKPTSYRPEAGSPDAYDDEPDTFSRLWQTIADHTQFVIREATALPAALSLEATFSTALRAAALWHDIGKAHPEFQQMLRNGDASRAGALWAKSANSDGRCQRRGFRHELASALAWLLSGPAGLAERDLVAYLIAAHHGKVRLSIRSLPNETGNPEVPDALFARGLWQGDKLPAVPLGELTTPEISLDLSFMQMGEGPHGPSWLARTVSLRDRFGPFRLAFLETLLRAADARASRISAQVPSASCRASSGIGLREPASQYGAASALSAEERSLVAELVTDGLEIQDKFRPEPLYKKTGKGHYQGNTVEEIRRAKAKGRRHKS